MRQPTYMKRRHEIEEILRTRFMKKGGIVRRNVPHYMVIEHCPWLSTWFDDSGYIKIHIKEFDLKAISFTFGDAFPVFSDGQHKGDNISNFSIDGKIKNCISANRQLKDAYIKQEVVIMGFLKNAEDCLGILA